VAFEQIGVIKRVRHITNVPYITLPRRNAIPVIEGGLFRSPFMNATSTAVSVVPDGLWKTPFRSVLIVLFGVSDYFERVWLAFSAAPLYFHS
jgi:hypothetical protein